MEKRKLLIADSGEEFRMALQAYLQDDYHIRVCRDGNETLQMMESFRPDLMILDLMMPGIDGVTLLQRARERELSTTVLAVSRFYSDYILDALERLNVTYLIVKPCEVSAVAIRLQDMMEELQEEICEVSLPDVGTLVDNALRELSFQLASHNYPTIREAVLEAIRLPNQQVTKTLYLTVGKTCDGNGKQVEHAIRRGIKRAWMYRNQEIWDRYFGIGIGGTVTECPTNKVFLLTVSQYITAENRIGNAYSRKSV